MNRDVCWPIPSSHCRDPVSTVWPTWPLWRICIVQLCVWLIWLVPVPWITRPVVSIGPLPVPATTTSPPITTIPRPRILVCPRIYGWSTSFCTLFHHRACCSFCLPCASHLLFSRGSLWASSSGVPFRLLLLCTGRSILPVAASPVWSSMIPWMIPPIIPIPRPTPRLRSMLVPHSWLSGGFWLTDFRYRTAST